MTLDELAAQMEKGFGQVRENFRQVDENFRQVNDALATQAEVMGSIFRRVDSIEGRLGKVEERLDGIDVRLDKIETRLTGVDRKVDAVASFVLLLETNTSKLADRTEERLASMDREHVRQIEGLKHRLDRDEHELAGRAETVEQIEALKTRVSRLEEGRV